MLSDAGQLYLEAFRARCDAARRPGRRVVSAPGMHALLPDAADPLGRAVVFDDAALETLAMVMPAMTAGLVTVFDGAPRSRALVAAATGWRPDSATAMVCPDLAALPADTLPDGLAVRPVRRGDSEAADGVALLDATRVAVRAAGASVGTPEALAAHLGRLPENARLFAAVDPGGVIRATSAYAVHGGCASVFFVNTARDWRRRGIGGAMTAIALRGAHAAGADRACLDASALGRPIYRRLGFADAGRVTRFSRGRAS